MKRHFVHVYHVFRSKFAVDAESHADAISKAKEMLGSSPPARGGITGMVAPSMDLELHSKVGEGYLLSEDAEEIVSFLVDEVGDPDYSQSRSYNADGSACLGSNGTHSLSDLERDTVLAALRLWQRLGGKDTEEWDIATNGESHDGLGEEQIDELCERLNK